MRIAIAQLDPVVGAFEANVKKIKEAYTRACQEQARLLLTPELGLCGYPPHDLVERTEMFDRNERALAELITLTRDQSCALVVGHIARNPAPKGRAAQNVVSVLEKGKLVFRQAKSLLPTYDIFDEARYFEPAESVRLWTCDGRKVAMAICEDLWGDDPGLGKLYARDVVQDYQNQKAELLLSISSSPYEWEKRGRREKLHGQIAEKLGVPLVYVNQVGANDEILFDGSSFAVNSSGKVTGRLPIFRTSFGVLEVGASPEWIVPQVNEREDLPPAEIEVLLRGLVTGIREYFARSGFKSAILGLSGGIDSAVVAALAARALGPKNVLGLAMPSQYSSGHSLEDAELLAKNLGLGFEVRPIKFLFATAKRELAEGRGELTSLAQENLQARLRGLMLMTLSNHYGSLVLTTGNKSEIATGYCTLYGDMVGALAPIGDLFKTRVYELARYINQAWGSVIPERSITKPPSAELRPDQKDEDSLPPYEALDPLLADYVESGISVEELERRYLKTALPHDPQWVRKILKMVEISEYKRRQAAPVLKTSTKAFGIGRRIPIAKTWDQ